MCVLLFWQTHSLVVSYLVHSGCGLLSINRTALAAFEVGCLGALRLAGPCTRVRALRCIRSGRGRVTRTTTAREPRRRKLEREGAKNERRIIDWRDGEKVAASAGLR